MWAAGAAAVVGVGVAIVVQMPTSSAQPSVSQRIASGALRPAYVKVAGGLKRMPFFTGSRLDTVSTSRTAAAAGAAVTAPGAPGMAVQTLGCGKRNRGQDVRVNQDCSYRRQAE